jgi:tetrahydromethanopterin S-methyltransferase subunit G
MSDLQKTAIELLKPFVDAWSARNERQAAKEAGKLMFWGDGMLGLLRQIAEGDRSQKTFSELKKKFRESQQRVNETLIELAKLRGKLAGSRVAHVLDGVLSDFRYGKSMIRSEIEVIISLGSKDDVQHRAQQVCRDIGVLNGELERLYRMVYDK